MHRPGDRGAIYQIEEGESSKPQPKKFIGNTLIGGLEIESKPPVFGLFKDQQDDEKINADIDTLITYYRDLGFFRARISRQVRYNAEGERPRRTFVVDEGPRYRIAGIAFVGNQKLSKEELSQGLVLKENEFFGRELNQES